MCGIVGIVEPELGRSIPAAEVQRMVRTLNHRGPDEEGSVQLPGVALAMRAGLQVRNGPPDAVSVIVTTSSGWPEASA